MHGAVDGEVVDGLQPGQLESLIQRAQRFDAEAYELLVDAFGPRLFGFFYRLSGNRGEAEDLLQEVFLRVVRALPQYKHQDRFEAWLFRVAANLLRDRVRQARRAPTVISMSGGDEEANDPSLAAAWDRPDDSAASPDQALMHRERVDRMQEALAQLSAAEREVIMLRHYSDLTFVEIAELMDTPLGTALARGHRGLAKLRRKMEDDDEC